MEDFAKMSADFRKDLELPESKTRIATYESFYRQDGDSPLVPWKRASFSAIVNGVGIVLEYPDFMVNSS